MRKLFNDDHREKKYNKNALKLNYVGNNISFIMSYQDHWLHLYRSDLSRLSFLYH